MTIRISLLMALSAAACTVQAPDEQGVDPTGPDASVGGDPDDTTTPPEVRLHVDQPVSSTNYFTVPVSGQGPRGGSLLVNTPERGAYSTSIGADGCFCIDVPLTPNTPNTLTFKAMDEAANYSDEVSVSVNQAGSPPGQPAPGLPTNLSRGGTVYKTSMSLNGGSPSALTDGNPNTEVDYEDSWFDDNYLAVSFSQRGNVDFLRIRTAANCVATEYNLLISDAVSPGKAVKGAADWKFVYHQTAGDGDDAYQMFTPTPARHVAIEFLSGDCYGPLSDHVIREIDVHTPPPPPPNAPAVPSCANTTLTCGG